MSARKYREMYDRMNEERRQYFHDAKNESARSNLRMLKRINLFLIPFCVLAFCVTPFIVPGWRISLPYILLLAMVCVFAAFTVLYSRKSKISTNVANVSCVVYVLLLFAFLFWIDIFVGPSTPASFVPLVFVMVPAVFILRFRILVPLLALVEIVYVLLVFQFKETLIAQSDIFTSMVGLVFGYLMAFTIVQLRIQDNNAKREYQKRSMVDPVTGILNKYSFERSVRDTLEARDLSASCALIRLDIDNMKRMNDELGTLVGDMFLEGIAELLTSIFRGSDIIGRVGGDEFMIYVRNLKGEDWLASKCSFIQQEVKDLSNENGNINMTCSMGVAVAGKTKTSFEEMYTLSDDSLYKAKTRGRGKYVLHHVHTKKEVIQ